jgi:beta-lactam-binding protein with PASTA domain
VAVKLFAGLREQAGWDGRQVTIAVSKGPDLVVVPPLADLTPDQAAQTLVAAGFTVGSIRTA